MCNKTKIQQEKRKQTEGKYDTQQTEKENMMTNVKITCVIIETKKKFHII